MPILYYVPIIHSVEDYGSLGPAIQRAFVRRGGKTAFDQFQENINEFWKIVEERIKGAIPDVRNLIIYHDGFPVGGKEKILALFGHMCQDYPESPNFRLVKKMLDKGAALEGTEDMNLVIEQLQLYQRAAESVSANEQKKILTANAARSQEITKLRDEFIAKRINNTLPEDRQGILFLGRDHDVISELKKLPRKFTVICL